MLQFASRFCSVSQVQIQLLKTCLEYRTGPYRTGTGTYRDKKAAGDAPHASRTRANSTRHRTPMDGPSTSHRGAEGRMAGYFRACGAAIRSRLRVLLLSAGGANRRTEPATKKGARMQAECKQFASKTPAKHQQFRRVFSLPKSRG